VSNVVGAAQSWLMNRRWEKKPMLPPPAAEVPASKASKKIAPPADKPAPPSKASKKLAAPAVDDAKEKSAD
jgi:hypothetical protein